MKFTIDIEEFWIDSDDDGESLAEELRLAVTREAVKKIKNSIGDRVETLISQAIRELSEDALKKVIDGRLTEFMAKGVIQPSSYNKSIPIEEYLYAQFSNDRRYNLCDKIKELGDEFSKKLKMQYDAVYATEVVKALDKQGLLKTELSQLLTSDIGKA
jgi:hypothetical protein